MFHYTPQTQKVPYCLRGTENVWHEFWKRHSGPVVPAIRARVKLVQPTVSNLQFMAETGSGHQFLVDDAKSATGPKPIELLVAALAGCAAFDVITSLRQSNQRVTRYEVRVEADQTERPPQEFFSVRIHHIVTGNDIDPAVVSDAIQVSSEKHCAIQAMLRSTTTTITNSFEVACESTGEPHEQPEKSSKRI